jgi:hypothetical protein
MLHANFRKLVRRYLASKGILENLQSAKKCYARGVPTVCVTCVWAGVDNAWEQEKLEARKMLENAAESHTSGARFVGTLFSASATHLI